MGTYSITEWSEHQHYKDRDPNWVKLYQRTLTSVTWLKADTLARLVMLASVLLAARYQNAIPLDEDVLIPMLAPRSTKWGDVMLAIRYLEVAGFVQVDASPENIEQDIGQKENKISKRDEHESFPDFWKAYPSRGKAANPRKPATKAHLSAIARGADPAELVRLAPTAAPAEKHGTEFVPQATTWLNEDRWKDTPKIIEPEVFNQEHSQWRARCNGFVKSRIWMVDQWGPKPNETGCKAPAEIIKETQADLVTPDFLRRNLTMAG